MRMVVVLVDRLRGTDEKDIFDNRTSIYSSEPNILSKDDFMIKVFLRRIAIKELKASPIAVFLPSGLALIKPVM